MLRRTLVLAASAALALPTLVGTSNAAPPDTTPGDARVCADAAAGYAHCDAHVRTKGAKPDATTTRGGGYISSDLRTAYGLSNLSSTSTVAIVDAYASPNAAADLEIYRANTGLPPLNGLYSQMNQTGGATMPSGDTGWGQEQMLDLEMVSAICPTCHILYVGGNSASFADLSTAVDTAAAQPGVVAISNSYGGGEFSSETTQESHYNHPNIAVTVSSGDSGYGAEFPAASRYVTAVGGTSLTLNANKTRKTETVWSGAGSGCSSYIAKPTWQPSGSCGTKRTIADVSAVADPQTGVAVYDSYGSSGGANWFVFGGTSVAAPIIGTVYALSGNTSGVPASKAYGAPAGSLFDVTSGSNGRCVRGKSTSGAYLCTGVSGYDGPTGNGTPIGVGAF